MAPFVQRLLYLLGRGPLSRPLSAPGTTEIDRLLAQIADLSRRLEDSLYAVKNLSDESDRLRQTTRLTELDRDAAREELKLYAAVIERDRKRLEAETAIFAQKIAKAERGD